MIIEILEARAERLSPNGLDIQSGKPDAMLGAIYQRAALDIPTRVDLGCLHPPLGENLE